MRLVLCITEESKDVGQTINSGRHGPDENGVLLQRRAAVLKLASAARCVAEAITADSRRTAGAAASA